jgi:hypothetical protein
MKLTLLLFVSLSSASALAQWTPQVQPITLPKPAPSMKAPAPKLVSMPKPYSRPAKFVAQTASK